MGKTFLINGGNFINKGAEAMMYTCVSEIKSRNKDNKCVIATYEDKNYENIAKNCDFDIIKIISRPDILNNYNVLTKCLAKIICFIKNKKLDPGVKELLNKTDYMIDISGYALSSQWGVKASLNYLLYILLMKKHGIKVILMPQSFGPFNYGGISQKIIDHYIKKALSYCEKIYAREEEGYELLTKKYNLKNVKKSLDLVLQSKSIDYSLVFKEIPKIEDIDIKQNSVAIVPNIRVFERAKNINYMQLYKEVVDKLLSYNKNIYLLYHSSEDIEICNNIKEEYKENDKVVVINKELSSYEYSKVVLKFDYIIASRYHSIVHAYKENVPSVSLGWAIKYEELMKNFNQEKYCVDIRKIENANVLIELIEDMNKNLNNNKMLLEKGLKIAQENNVFEVLDEI